VAPAAVVAGHRISQDTLKSEFDAILLDPQVKQQLTGANGERNRKDLTRRLLAFLIQLQIVHQYADASRISVGRAEVDRALQQTIQQVGGEAQFQQELKARGLTLHGVRRNLQRQLLFRRVEDSLAARAGLTSTATQQDKDRAFQRWFAQRLSSAEIDVNPRFGRLDPKTGQILPITSTAA
jgi:SurA-like protein